MECLKDIADIVQNLAVSLAVLFGGGWALYQFLIQRAHETCLLMDFSATSLRQGTQTAVFLETILTNIGRRRIVAKRGLNGRPAFQDFSEVLRFSCEIQVRALRDAAPPPGGVIDWFNASSLTPVPGIPDHINLLGEYETSPGGDVDFWLEPAEVSHLGTALFIPAGNYLAKITFVGNRSDSEFWSRVCNFKVE